MAGEPTVNVAVVEEEGRPAARSDFSGGETEADQLRAGHDPINLPAGGVVTGPAQPSSEVTSVAAASRYLDRVALDVGTDFVALLLSAITGLLFLSVVSRDPANSLSSFWLSLLHLTALFPGFLIAFATYGLYRRSAKRIQPPVFDDLKDIAHAIAAGGFLAVAIVVAIHKVTAAQISVNSQLVAMGGVGLILVPATRALVSSAIRWRVYGQTRIVVLGTGVVAQQVARRIRATRGVTLVGFVDDDPRPGSEVICPIAKLPELCRANRVDQVIVAFTHTHPATLTTLLRPLHGLVSISVVPRYFDLVSPHSQIEEIYGLPIVDVAAPRLGLGSRLVKRAFDITLASVSLVALAPLLVAIAAMIKLSSPGPVVFRQTRIGYQHKPFTIFKFRTMTVGAEHLREGLRDRNQADGPLFKVTKDPRTTIVGRILRRTSLDELPQLWNVLRGDMSLVGPRPFVPEESMQIDGWAARRFDVRPGLTGQWQVSGRNQLSHIELCRLDYLYVACWSMQWDLRILWQTVGRVVSGYGAS